MKSTRMASPFPKEEKDVMWARAGFRLLLTTVTHPIEYAKFLIQIGYEPIAPRATKTFFGKPAKSLPNVFEYISYIKSVDGAAGCFRGLSAKVCANITHGAVFETVKKSIHFESDIKSLIDEDGTNEEIERRHNYAKEFVRELIGKSVAVVMSHPFHVIAGRMMAQFIGRETKYSTILSSAKEIYELNGISGFFSGLAPRLIGDLIGVCIITSCTYIIHVHCTEDREIRNYCDVITGLIPQFKKKLHKSTHDNQSFSSLELAVIISISNFFTQFPLIVNDDLGVRFRKIRRLVLLEFFASSFTYPFHVVSNCMIVTNSALKAGSSPYMPEYKSWLNCWRHLKSTNQIKRGSSLFWRYYPGTGNLF